MTGFAALVAIALGACNSPIRASKEVPPRTDAADVGTDQVGSDSPNADTIAPVAPSSSDAPDGNQVGGLDITDKVDLGTVVVGATVSGQVHVFTGSALTDFSCMVSSGGNITPDPSVAGTCTATLAAGAGCVIGFNFMTTTPGLKLGDQVACSVGGITHITPIVANVVPPAKVVISAPSGAVTATVGNSSDFVLEVLNAGGTSTGQLAAAINPTDPEFIVAATTCATGLAPFATCTVTVTFKPATVGSKMATLSVTDAAAPATPVTATLNASGLPTDWLGMGPSGTTDFGSVPLGSSGTAVIFTIKNTGNQPATDIAVATSDPQFVIGSNTCSGLTLAPITGSCTFTITFTPFGTLGVHSALITTTCANGRPTSLPILGTAITPAALTLTPAPLAFDGIALYQQSGEKFLTVTNTGGASTGALTIPTYLDSGFAISGHTCTTALQATESCSIAIRFTPDIISQVTFTLTVSSASGAVGTTLLTGTGRVPPTLALDPRYVEGCDWPLPPDAGAAPAQCFARTVVGQTDGSSPNQQPQAPVAFTVTYVVPDSYGGSSLETGPVTVSIGGDGASDFVIAARDCGPSMQPTQSCTFKVSFKPTASGGRKAIITVTSTNGGNVVGIIQAVASPVDGGT